MTGNEIASVHLHFLPITLKSGIAALQLLPLLIALCFGLPQYRMDKTVSVA